MGLSMEHGARSIEVSVEHRAQSIEFLASLVRIVGIFKVDNFV
jgi:hypothetical protein